LEGDEDSVPRVSLADAKAAYETGGAVFVDVRDAESYAQSHIPGALSIPLSELPNRIGELNPSDWIITY
jgi:rhodanese-related sulfurtransferase